MKSVIIIASGPSLCQEDVISCITDGRDAIAINSSWKIIPTCKYIYSGDFNWWHHYYHTINVGANLWTSSKVASRLYSINHHRLRCRSFNSGAKAILFAVERGYDHIILLGFDCALSESGRTHWHGDHPSGLGNPSLDKMYNWLKQFELLKELLPGVEIINSSRKTALNVFPCVELKQALLSIR
ncbi:hypothetical protein [Pantoea sp. BAV 3049]|uniref:hypothetical protein n=1 Tax=Pantoea sp. BAV 3049 TaxID=2654188 RepID=UPI0018EF0C80|nr:hypothetical protein [Pantoea sp. BAV 3049]